MRRILLLADNSAVRRVIEDVLTRDLGCTVMAFSAEWDARAAWIEGQFHGAIIDAETADGNGLDLARYVRATSPAALLVVVSAAPDAVSDVCDALGCGLARKSDLRRGVMREIGFDGTLPAGLAGKPK